MSSQHVLSMGILNNLNHFESFTAKPMSGQKILHGISKVPEHILSEMIPLMAKNHQTSHQKRVQTFFVGLLSQSVLWTCHLFHSLQQFSI